MQVYTLVDSKSTSNAWFTSFNGSDDPSYRCQAVRAAQLPMLESGGHCRMREEILVSNVRK